MDRAFAAALTVEPPAVTALDAWRAATAAVRAAGSTPIARAFLGGVAADRLGFAFAGGYAEALRALVPAHPRPLAALCATEEGGAHPRAIRTALTAAGDGFLLAGHKRWATMSAAGGDLLVIATRGDGPDGKPRLVAVTVAADAPGVTLTPASAPFVPEIPHATVALADVAVAADAVLPGDGYATYLKPFRTVEDLHVHAALCGYLIGVARRHHLGDALVERGLALAAALATLGAADPRAAATHRALAGAIDLASDQVAALEAAWAAVGGDEWQRWQRDRPLLGVARAARAARLERARQG
ncbi:MAG: acyl-CoA dehydrogenase [Myxococcales bacterium]|nr:acyl-CoA dehydrogenase [Myxococcales bacterium]MBK7198065.1 acyl-CoA dehydrogenase [Myxococcales bacterium]